MHFKIIQEYTLLTWKVSQKRQVVMSRAGALFGLSNGITFSTYAFLFYIGELVDFSAILLACCLVIFFSPLTTLTN